MKKVLVVGAGRMGTAVGFALDKLGIQPCFVDVSNEALRKVKDVVPNCIVYHGREYTFDIKYDAVFSAATYTENLKWARWAVDYKLPYFDLGGHVGTSKEIQDYSTANGGLVFTDLGLAPGLVNILGEFACDELQRIGDKPHTLKLRVGGLPSPYYDMGLLKYNRTWSVEGLINEYFDPCDVLFAGGHCKVNGLTDIEEVRWSRDRVFEAFNTSGGLSHTLASAQRRGLVEANYKTLRYKGHAQQVAFLSEAVGGDRKKLEELILATTVSHEHDLVLVYVQVEGKHQTLTKRYEIFPKDGFTAMQRATAFSAVAAMKVVLELKLVGNVLEYRNVDKELFNFNLYQLGIEL